MSSNDSGEVEKGGGRVERRDWISAGVVALVAEVGVVMLWKIYQWGR